MSFEQRQTLDAIVRQGAFPPTVTSTSNDDS
jgi:hypothetical protein